MQLRKSENYISKSTASIIVRFANNQPDNKTIPLKTLEKRRHLMSRIRKEPANLVSAAFWRSESASKEGLNWWKASPWRGNNLIIPPNIFFCKSTLDFSPSTCYSSFIATSSPQPVSSGLHIIRTNHLYLSERKWTEMEGRSPRWKHDNLIHRRQAAVSPKGKLDSHPFGNSTAEFHWLHIEKESVRTSMSRSLIKDYGFFVLFPF